jgi:light-regulated signal transduction histidine kinase (bacteriophytochrome)
LLAYSTVERHGKEFLPTSCETVLAHVLENLAVSIADCQAQITHDPLPQVMADEVQLGQLFQNLVSNALKFRASEPPRIHIGLARQDAHWVFSVRDNGLGIDPQYFERIFIIFQRLHTRSKYEGTGIGLAVSKRIVERHGGQIWVESQPGAGSTFFFTIPISGEPKL